MKRLIAFLSILLALTPAIAQQAPLVTMSGQTRQLPSTVVLGPKAGVAYTTTYATIAALRLQGAGAVPGTVFVQGYSAAGDGGAGLFAYTASDTTSADNGGTIIVDAAARRWYRIYSDRIEAAWFGVDATGATDSTTKVAAAIAVAKGRPIKFGPGDFLFSCGTPSCVIFATSEVPLHIEGAGNGSGPGPGAQNSADRTRFFMNCSSCTLFSATTSYPSIFRDFNVNTKPAARPSSGIGILLTGYIASNPTAVVANYKIQNVSFTEVGTPIRVVRPQWGEISGSYFDQWYNNAIQCVTTSGVEGSCGFIRHNYFFGNNTLTTSAIYSEVGYTIVEANELLGGEYGVEFNFKNFPAGFGKIVNNTIENQRTSSIFVRSGDCSDARMVQIQGNEFSDLFGVASTTITIAENTSCPTWLKSLLIQGNTLRNVSKAGAIGIWVQAAQNAIISGNNNEELGVNNATFIQVAGATINTGLVAPILLADNVSIGTTSKYSLTGTMTTLRDQIGGTQATTPTAVAPGSQYFMTDGTPGSSPCTGGSTGAQAFRQNGAWKCF